MSNIYNYSEQQIQFNHSVDSSPIPDSFQMHLHETYEIFYFIAGDATFLVEGNEYPLEPGSLVTMRTSESHKIKLMGTDSYERYTLHFLPSFLDPIDPNHLFLQPFHDHPLGQNNLYRPSEFKEEQPLSLLKSMCTGSDNPEEKRLAVLSYVYPLLNLLRNTFLQKQNFSETASRSLTEELVAYINLHLFEEISLDTISKHFFLSSSQLSRLFKQATGSSIWDYIMIKRLLAARSKIRAGVPFNKAAFECGFRDYSSFYRAYVHKFGVSPKNDLLK